MGTVYLVGAGPGDPELITLKGLELLKVCDVVIYDRLASYQLLEHLKDNCVKIYVGKKAGHHSKKQDEINRIIVESACNYEKVVRLKGGDPFVFGRGGEEIEELQKYNLPYEVVPGVTSAIAALDSAGIPVTYRGVSQSFHVIAGHTKSSEDDETLSEDDDTLTDNYEVLAKLEGTLVFLMGLSNLEQIANKLMQYGKDGNTPAAVISNGTMKNEKICRATLDNIAVEVNRKQMVSPAIIVVGNTAALHFVQIKQRPLSNLKIGITGTKAMCDKLEKGLQMLGAEVHTVCDMHIMETPSVFRFEAEIKTIGKYHWIIFTSQNAISVFFKKMEECRIDRRNLNNIKFAVVGSGTKLALQKYGYFADFIPGKYTTKDLAVELSTKIADGDRLFIPRALKGSKELTDIFDSNNIQYNDLPIYDVKGELTENIVCLSELDCLVFVSASGVTAFFEQIKVKSIRLPSNIKIACIGDVTAEAVKKYNVHADIIASVNSSEGLIEEITKIFEITAFKNEDKANESYEKT